MPNQSCNMKRWLLFGICLLAAHATRAQDLIVRRDSVRQEGMSVMSRFHRYSVNNTMLIYMQKPDATSVSYTHLDVYKRQPQSSPGRAEAGKGKCKCPVPEVPTGKSSVCQQPSLPLAAKTEYQKAVCRRRQARRSDCRKYRPGCVQNRKGRKDGKRKASLP